MEIVNRFGTVTGWKNVRMELLGRAVVGITKISYSDELEQELIYGQGNYPIGKGDGNYKASCSFDLMHEERAVLIAQLPPNTRLQELPDFDITVMYSHKGKDYKDVIKHCSFINNGVELNQGDKSHGFSFEVLPTHIQWDV